MTVEIHSLGCRLNIAESETLRGFLGTADDLVVINSCAVTAEAVRQTRQAIRRARRARPDARLIVTGCAAEVERDMLGRMPEVDGLVANAAKLDPRAWNVPAAGNLNQGPLVLSLSKDAGAALEPFDKLRMSGSEADILQHASPERRGYTRGFVQVQNGCDHSCTFCVIPQGRGPSRSRPIAEVLEDITVHADAGVREIVLTGVDLTSWGADLPGAPRLGALCEAILARFPALPRLRLSSVDGAEVDGALFELLAGEARMMPHLHLSLQHGDDLILKRMKRRHSRADAIALVEGLRSRREDLAIGADIMAGFPTEDAAAHANNVSIVEALRIVHGHVFPYSRRPGTPAARMPQVDPAEVRIRAAELRAVIERQREGWLEALVGRSLSVLAEKGGTGHAENFAKVRLPEGTEPGTLISITPARVVEGILEA